MPEIYALYKNGPRLKYPASLHVTVKSILPPGSFEPGIRSLYSINAQRVGESNEDAAQNETDYEQAGDEISVGKTGAKTTNQKEIESVNNSKGKTELLFDA